MELLLDQLLQLLRQERGEFWVSSQQLWVAINMLTCMVDSFPEYTNRSALSKNGLMFGSQNNLSYLSSASTTSKVKFSDEFFLYNIESKEGSLIYECLHII